MHLDDRQSVIKSRKCISGEVHRKLQSCTFREAQYIYYCYISRKYGGWMTVVPLVIVQTSNKMLPIELSLCWKAKSTFKCRSEKWYTTFPFLNCDKFGFEWIMWIRFHGWKGWSPQRFSECNTYFQYRGSQNVISNTVYILLWSGKGSELPWNLFSSLLIFVDSGAYNCVIFVKATL